ncbi:MAG: CBS domain-containing protein [Pseudobdellovibrio sp.]
MEKIFNSKLICIESGSEMAEAKKLMREKRIRHLPVVTPDNCISGILTAHDLTDVDKYQDLAVDLFASFPVKFITPEARLSDVALRMIAEKVSCLLIVEDGKATGIITTDDLLYEFSKLQKEKEENASTLAQTLITAGEFFRKLADIGI